MTSVSILPNNPVINYPNPFNPSITINFELSEKNFTNILVYNLLGEKIANLTDEYHFSGNYSVSWNADNNPSGVYLVEMVSVNNVVNKMARESLKIMLVK